jgi:uncharacterized protein RhaS with RHS repeats
LLYRRNRYYDPTTGQFTQEDPIGIAGGLNLYGYANGDPLGLSDPFGLCPGCGKIIRLLVRGGNTVGERVLKKNVPSERLSDLLNEGEDLLVGSGSQARDIARQAGGGRSPVGPESHRAGRPHYHRFDRQGGHIFYSAASALTVSNYIGDDAGPLVSGGAAAIDFFNPLALFKDLLDTASDLEKIGSMIKDAGGG